jgi:hypothetical protein
MIQATSFIAILSDADRHKLKELSVSLRKNEVSLTSYKDTLANTIRRLNDLTSVVTKLHRRTSQEIADCDKIILEINGLLGEVKQVSDEKVEVLAK